MAALSVQFWSLEKALDIAKCPFQWPKPPLIENHWLGSDFIDMYSKFPFKSSYCYIANTFSFAKPNLCLTRPDDLIFVGTFYILSICSPYGTTCESLSQSWTFFLHVIFSFFCLYIRVSSIVRFRSECLIGVFWVKSPPININHISIAALNWNIFPDSYLIRFCSCISKCKQTLSFSHCDLSL